MSSPSPPSLIDFYCFTFFFSHAILVLGPCSRNYVCRVRVRVRIWASFSLCSKPFDQSFSLCLADRAIHMVVGLPSLLRDIRGAAHKSHMFHVRACLLHHALRRRPPFIYKALSEVQYRCLTRTQLYKYSTCSLINCITQYEVQQYT